MQNKKILFFCDNLSVVSIVNNQTSPDNNLMELVRHLVLTCLKNNIVFRAKHIPGVQNKISDAISRWQMDKFRQLAPHADKDPTPLPQEFLVFCQT